MLFRLILLYQQSKNTSMLSQQRAALSREFVVFQVTPSLGSILCSRTIDISYRLLIPPLSQEEEIASTALLGSFRAYVRVFHKELL